MAKKLANTFHTPIGTHIIADLYDCTNLSNNSSVREILLQSAKESKGTVLHTKFHDFEPQGLTGYILLAESHISIHTWPESGYAAVDVFTCGTTMQPKAAVAYIQKMLGAKNVRAKTVRRNGVVKDAR